MGRAAVMVFFVLSGFVLAVSLLKAPSTYGGFAIKRLFRIYPAFLVVIAISYALHRSFGAPLHTGSVLMNRISAPDLSPLQLCKALVLWGTAPSLNLDLVTWSLVHEMRISLLFPLILLSVRRAAGVALPGYAMVSVACTVWLHATSGNVAYGFVEETFPQTLAVTGYFLIFFACGAWLAIERERVTAWLRTSSLTTRKGLLVIALAFFLKGDHGPEEWITSLVDYAHLAAALLMLSLILGTEPFERALSGSTLRWLGRISYSLYLVHLPVLYVVGQTLGLNEPLRAVGAVVVLSLGFAQILANLVEFPCIALARRAGRRINSSI